MKFGIFIPTFADSPENGNPGFAPSYSNIDWKQTTRYAVRAEQLGFDSIWVPDHLIMGKDDTIIDPLITLGALATATTTIKLGTVVLCSAFRHPSILAKMVATLDFISQGRFILGIGSGFHQREFNAWGFPPVDRSVTEEIVKILKLLWDTKQSELVAFNGKHFTLDQAVSKPTPINNHIPIFIGGNSDMTLNIAANHANGWITGEPLNTCAERLGSFKKYLNTEEKRRRVNQYIWFGPAVLKKSNNDTKPISRGIGGTVAKLTEEIIFLKNLGFTKVILAFPDFPDVTMAESFTREVIPSL